MDGTPGARQKVGVKIRDATFIASRSRRMGVTITIFGAAFATGTAALLFWRPTAESEASAIPESRTPVSIVPEVGPLPPDGGDQSPIRTRALSDAPAALPSWFATLARATSVKDESEAEAARYAIRHHFRERRPDVPALLSELPKDGARHEVIPLLIDVHGAPRAGELRQWLAAQPAGVRSAAYFRLARLGPEGRAVLAEALPAEEDERTGSEALLWLLRRRGDEGFIAASRMAQSEEAVLRSAMTGLLQRPTDQRLLGVLRRALERPLPFRVREAIVDVIAATYPPKLRERPASAAELFARARDLDVVTKTLALREAGNFMDEFKRAEPPPEDIERVRTLVRDAVILDPDPLVRRAAVLSRVGLRSDLNDLAGQCAALLQIAEQDLDPGVRAAVLRRVHRGCAHTSMPFGPAYLVPYVKDEPDPDVRREALRTLPRWKDRGEAEVAARKLLVWAMERDPDPSLRLEAAALLTELGYEAARPHLERAGRQDHDPVFRDALYRAFREQLAGADPELFEALRALDPARAGDSPPSGGSRKPIPRDTLRLIPEYRRVAEAKFPKAEARDQDSESVDAAVEDRPPEPADPSGWIEAEITFPPAGEGLRLAGLVYFPAGIRSDLLMVLPPDPLLGGTPWPIGWRRLCAILRARGIAIMTFSWRGRGASEGFSGGGLGESADLQGALAWAQSSSRSGHVAGLHLSGTIHVLALGRGAEFAERIDLAPVRFFALAPCHGDPPTSQEAFRRALGLRNDDHSADAVDLWLDRGRDSTPDGR